MSDEYIKISECNNGIDYVSDNRLYFEDGRLFIKRIPYKNEKQSDFSEKVDVTEDVLNVFLKILDKHKG